MPLEELVVPAGNVHDGYLDEIGAGIELLPVVVVAVVVDEVVPVGEDVAFAQDRGLAEGHGAEEGCAVRGARGHLAAELALAVGIDAHAHHGGEGPALGVAEVEAELEGAAAVDPAVVEVGGGEVSHGGLEVGRGGGRRLEGGHAHVGGAVDANLAVAPGLDSGPLDGVVAVVPLVPVKGHDALGLEAAAAVLDDHGVAVLGGDDGVHHLAADVLGDRLVIGDAVDEDGVLLVVVGAVDVGGEADAIAHGNHDIAFDEYLRGHQACVPPSMTSSMPVTKEASSEAR